MNNKSWKPWALLSPAITAVFFMLVIPLCFVVIYSFWLRGPMGQDIPAFQFGNYAKFFEDFFYPSLLIKTVRVAIETVILSLIMGYIPAYFFYKTESSFKPFLLILIMLPFWISFIIRTLSWINILGDSGLINHILLKIGLIDTPLPLLYNEAAVLMGLLQYLLPFMILNIYVSLEGIDKNLTDAAKSLGCTEWQAFKEITLPLSMPGVSAGCMLVFVLTCGTYLPPMILGGPGNDMIANLIFKRIITTLDWPFGSALSVILLTLLIIIIYVYNKYMGIDKLFQTIRGQYMKKIISGGSLIRIYTIFIYIWMFAPIAAVIILSFNPLQFGSFPMKGFSFRWYSELMHNVSILNAFKNSMILGSLTAFFATVIGIPAAIALTEYKFKGKNFLNMLLITPIMIPEVVLGVSLLLFMRWLRQPKSFIVLLIGHIVITLPYVILVVQARLVGIKKEYEEAARTLGAGPLQTFREITFPLLYPAIFAGLLFSFTISFDDVTATLFWATAKSQTVPVKIFGMLRSSISPEINALGAIMILLTVSLPLIAGYTIRKFAQWQK